MNRVVGKLGQLRQIPSPHRVAHAPATGAAVAVAASVSVIVLWRAPAYVDAATLDGILGNCIDIDSVAVVQHKLVHRIV